MCFHITQAFVLTKHVGSAVTMLQAPSTLGLTASCVSESGVGALATPQVGSWGTAQRLIGALALEHKHKVRISLCHRALLLSCHVISMLADAPDSNSWALLQSHVFCRLLGTLQHLKPDVIAVCCRERQEALAAVTKSQAAGALRRALVAVGVNSQVAVLDAETGCMLSR